MPFPIVYGIPQGTSDEKLAKLRENIVAKLVEVMEVPANWVRPFFPFDLLPDPQTEADGSNTIYVALDTGMFHGKENADTLASKVTEALARVVWDAFEGRFEVECMVHGLNPNWKTLIEVKEPETQ